MTTTARRLPGGPVAVDGLADVRSALDAVGYRSEAIRELLEVGAEMPLHDSDIVVYRRRLDRSPGALADVIALFSLGSALPRAHVDAALGARAVDVLLASGALVDEDGAVVATVRLIAHGDLYIAADARPDAHDEPDPLLVTGLNSPAGLLAALTVRRPVAAALDLGTGNGIQAMLAARHAERVVATDVNPRAISYARFNAALNGIANIDFRVGSLFEPVRGERFDLVVTNPPYVISPDNDYVYRDSGSAPAAMCREIVESAPAHLQPGGFATVLASWPAPADGDWSDVPASWLSPAVDAWLLFYASEDPLTHAAKWNRPAAEAGPEAYAAAIDRWTSFDDAAGIVEIAYGALVLRGRGDGAGRIVGRDRLRIASGTASAQILRVFAAHDAGPHGLEAAERRVRLTPGHHLDQTMYFEDGTWQLATATLTASEGIEMPVALDAVTVQALVALDGTRTVEAAADIAAQACGIGADDLPQLVELVGRLAAELYRLGILEPAES